MIEKPLDYCPRCDDYGFRHWDDLRSLRENGLCTVCAAEARSKSGKRPEFLKARTGLKRNLGDVMRKLASE